MYNIVLFLTLLSSAVDGLAFRSVPAVATHCGGFKQLTPEPTPAQNQHELVRRQASTTQRTLLAATDNVCGYLGGKSDAPWGCTAGANCMFATPTLAVANSTQTQAAVGSVLCCDSSSGCPAQPSPTACVDHGRNDYNKTCTGNCPDDPMTLKCTSGIYIYCNTLIFPTPSVSALFCNYLSTYSPLPAITAALTPTLAHFAPPITSTSSISSKSLSKTSSATKSATPKPATGGEEKKVGKGAIIGGAVGGVLGLAVLIGLGVLLLKRRGGKERGKVEAVVKGKESASASEENVAARASPTGSMPKSVLVGSGNGSPKIGGSGKKVVIVE